MYQVDTSTAVTPRPDRQPAGTQGWFSAGNATIGQRGTKPGYDWFNTMQAEVINVGSAAGITPSKTVDSQLWEGILGARRLVDVSVTPNTITCNPTVPLTAYRNGQEFRIKPNTTSTGASVINISSLGNISIVRPDGSQTQANDIVKGIYFSGMVDSGVLVMSGMPQTRTRLGADLNLYVASNGNNTNNGLSTGAPFATPLYAATFVQNNIDLNGYHVRIYDLGTGSLPGFGIIGAFAGPQICADGSNAVQLLGGTGSIDLTSAASHTLDGSLSGGGNGNGVGLADGGMMLVKGFTVLGHGSGNNGFGTASNNGGLLAIDYIIYGVCDQAHIYAGTYGIVGGATHRKITGAAPVDLRAIGHGRIIDDGCIVTSTGSIAFSAAFALVDENAEISSIGADYSGVTATGVRCIARTGGGAQTGGAGASAFPGNSADVITSPGWKA